jgi:hypothetical protein
MPPQFRARPALLVAKHAARPGPRLPLITANAEAPQMRGFGYSP